VAHVLLTHSYHLPFDSKQLRKMQPYMPIGTLYAATALRENAISVEAFDSMLEDPSAKFDSLLATCKPQIVAVYEDDFNFLSKMCLTRMRDVAWKIAKAARAMGAITVVHGSDSTDNPRLFIENGFDYVLCGEAEESLVRLCRSILDAEEVPELDGMVKLDECGRLVRSSQRLSKNLEWSELPLPARDLVDMELYRKAWVNAHGYFSTNMVSSRGCPYKCNWCAKPISGNKFHLRSAASVAEEMKLLKVSAGVQHIWFGDDVFALDRHWVQRFAEEVAKRDAAVPFKIQSRADLMSETTVRNLKAAGCAEVWIRIANRAQCDGQRADSLVCPCRPQLAPRGRHSCMFLPAVWLSGRNMGRTPGDHSFRARDKTG
jgi:anaerobic magnesium-protoporphyrin IX monomethyl ester cyclase